MSRKGEADALVVTANPDDSLKVKQSRVLREGNLINLVARLSLSLIVGFMGILAGLKGVKRTRHAHHDHERHVKTSTKYTRSLPAPVHTRPWSWFAAMT
jgi:hypothetical protein